jgi:hypothetical protein
MAWSDAAANYLRGSTSCPRCERGPVGPEHCPFCGAMLVGEVADELKAVSSEAAELLTRRQEIIGRLTTKAALAPPPTGVPAAAAAAPVGTVAAPAPAPAFAPAAAAAPRNSTVSLQSVLAVAAAALIAIAVLVFRFSNTGTELSIRQLVIAGVTIVFLGFAWLLARMKLTFSAEAVGVVAMVFVALDVWAISENGPDSVSPWASAAVSTLVAAVLTLAIALLVRLRTWLWIGLVALIFVPAFFGYAVDGPWSAVVGHVGAVAVALLGFEIVQRMSPRFESPLRADRVTVVIAAALFGVVALLGLLAVDVPEHTPRVLGWALVVAVLAVLAGFGTRTLGPAAWSAAAGVFATSAAGLVALSGELDDESWRLVLVPAVTAVALAAIAVVPWPAALLRTPLRVGAFVVALAAATPALLIGLTQLLSPLAPRFLNPVSWYPDAAEPVPFWFAPMEDSWSLWPSTPSLAAILGIVAVSAGVLGLALAVRRENGTWRPWLVLATWLAAAALAAAPAWSALSRPGQVVAGIAVALGIGLALLFIPRVKAAAWSIRTPLLVAAHGILLYLTAISWGDERLTVAAGAAIVVTLGVLAMTVSARVRPVYVAVGYAYALVLFARGLDLLGVDAIPVISYTTTVASVFALIITLVRRVRPALWYAVLGVTAVPFVVGIATVIAERTWETALANAAIFALSLTLTLTRRPGLTRFVRSGAAALLLPSLAVVVVNVIPRIIETNIVPAWNGAGGAPVTLPVIATLVALVLPTTPLVAGWLRRGELPEQDAASARLWIEISAFVTGGLAALLSLVLETPDLSTSLIVFVILGIGSASAGIFAKRRYGWWVAAACWTAALWCVWGLAGITDVEPYVYPPTIAAVIIGVVLALRGRNGAALVAPGLAIAIATSLIVLAITGSGPAALLPWRALALLAASLVLLLIGAALARTDGARWGTLRVPALVASMGAAAAGTIQAVRYATERDSLGLAHPDDVVWPVLAFSVTAAVLAASAARSLRSTHRWLQTPALVYLVLGPIAAVAPGVAPMWTLWALTLVLLGIMLVTVVAALRGPTIMPPTWIVFAAAWCTAVAGWSVRDLNVEWFSLPLGLALLGAGVLVLRHGPVSTPGTLASWPVGFTRSWAVLAPGIVVTVLPSVLATGTNPATWRAILVIGLALVALLVGAIGRYAAPFVLSLVTFGVEFAIILIQLAVGREIDPVVIWVVSLTAGAILFFVAIFFERRSRAGAEGARMRDLR